MKANNNEDQLGINSRESNVGEREATENADESQVIGRRRLFFVLMIDKGTLYVRRGSRLQ